MRLWIGAATVGGLALAFFPFAQRRGTASAAEKPPAAAADPSVVKPTSGPPPLSAIDLTKMRVDDAGVTAPAAPGRVAHLTIDPTLQRAAEKILASHKIPEAALVLTETATGRVLVWASHVEKGPARDLCVEANAPAASVFKIVTSAALVEHAQATPETRQCYSGGENRIVAADLVDDPKRDRWCATLSEAMGRSINTVFARLASKNLTPAQLGATGAALGFGEAPPFDVPVAANELHLPEDRLGFARTAAGFWNTTMSPLGGAVLASTIANQGDVIRPFVVGSVTEGSATIYRATEHQVVRHALHPQTAAAVTTMMESTVSGGTSFKAFHDQAGRSFLPEIAVAGKTGTLTRAETKQYYTWFVGFAPSRAAEVTVSALVVNGPNWQVKANVLARDLLRAYFARKGAPGVTKP